MALTMHLLAVELREVANNLIPNYPNRNTNTAWQIPADPELPLYIAQSNSAIYNVTIAYNNAGQLVQLHPESLSLRRLLSGLCAHVRWR